MIISNLIYFLFEYHTSQRHFLCYLETENLHTWPLLNYYVKKYTKYFTLNLNLLCSWETTATPL